MAQIKKTNKKIIELNQDISVIILSINGLYAPIKCQTFQTGYNPKPKYMLFTTNTLQI